VVLASLEHKMSLDFTVLVVDDDPQILEVTASAFEDIGLTVVRAEDGAAALEILQDNPEIELLFTDIMMPNMTGWELAHTAKQKYPDLKVIYTSGHIKHHPIGQHGLGYGPLLPKPWRQISFANGSQKFSASSRSPLIKE
jgi:CheY-like chemotaxis protein